MYRRRASCSHRRDRQVARGKRWSLAGLGPGVRMGEPPAPGQRASACHPGQDDGGVPELVGAHARPFDPRGLPHARHGLGQVRPCPAPDRAIDQERFAPVGAAASKERVGERLGERRAQGPFFALSAKELCLCLDGIGPRKALGGVLREAKLAPLIPQAHAELGRATRRVRESGGHGIKLTRAGGGPPGRIKETQGSTSGPDASIHQSARLKNWRVRSVGSEVTYGS
jgi:hypothetical protein